MRPSVIMLAVIAFVLAGAAAFLVKVFLEKQAHPVVVQEEKPKGVANVLVAARTINPGEILSTEGRDLGRVAEVAGRRAHDQRERIRGALRRLCRRRKSALSCALKKKATPPKKPEGGEEQQSAKSGPADMAIVGAVARRRIFANEPISPDQLIQRGDRSIGSAVVSPGMRAVSISISADRHLAASSRRATMSTCCCRSSTSSRSYDASGKQTPEGTRGRAAGRRRRWSSIPPRRCLRNVRVLAIDQSLGRNSEDGPADVGKTATLEVSPHDAEKLLTAAQLGSTRRWFCAAWSSTNQPQDDVDAFEDPFNFTTDVATSRAVSALHTTSSLYGYRGGRECASIGAVQFLRKDTNRAQASRNRSHPGRSGHCGGPHRRFAESPPAATPPEVPLTVVDAVPLANRPTVPGPNSIMLAPVDNNGNVVAPGGQRLVPETKSAQQTVAPACTAPPIPTTLQPPPPRRPAPSPTSPTAAKPIKKVIGIINTPDVDCATSRSVQTRRSVTADDARSMWSRRAR